MSVVGCRWLSPGPSPWSLTESMDIRVHGRTAVPAHVPSRPASCKNTHTHTSRSGPGQARPGRPVLDCLNWSKSPGQSWTLTRARPGAPMTGLGSQAALVFEQYAVPAVPRAQRRSPPSRHVPRGTSLAARPSRHVPRLHVGSPPPTAMQAVLLAAAAAAAGKRRRRPGTPTATGAPAAPPPRRHGVG